MRSESDALWRRALPAALCLLAALCMASSACFTPGATRQQRDFHYDSEVYVDRVVKDGVRLLKLQQRAGAATDDETVFLRIRKESHAFADLMEICCEAPSLARKTAEHWRGVSTKGWGRSGQLFHRLRLRTWTTALESLRERCPERARPR